MSFALESPVLDGTLVRLEPLDSRRVPDLAVISRTQSDTSTTQG
jgi:hypothetical protein